MAPFCEKLIRLADDFDFDGIQNFMIELNGLEKSDVPKQVDITQPGQAGIED